ncbi:ABC transporter substrate-binding protein [Jiangella asiatica]|uniref:ABC transporter substrate-binding protein n=1 Tax=Jiangella asiatica TaxID=2530372 RepID=A0A4R5DK00_9ACTN|nr:ABC transporter substrate-binding protein [Jiangella asiatica]TDE11165.1 ABC transporter substrate-binding protein [Jiangella asiatica]
MRRRIRSTSVRLAALVITAALAASACGSPSPGSGGPAPDDQGSGENVLVANIAEAVTTLDPARGSANGMATVGYAIYDTLMKVESLGDEPTPNIAESLEPNDDFTVWTMTLPAGLKFSDGTDFDAAAVKFNMDRHLDPDAGSTAAALLSSVESVTAPDETTVVFTLKYPFSNFPTVLAFDGSGTAGYVASPTALEEHGDDYTAHAAGVGPFKLESWAPGADVVLVRNPEYWNRDEKEIQLDQVVLKNIQDEQSLYQAIQAGDIDLGWFAEPSILKDATTNDRVKYTMGVGSDQESIALNMTAPPFDDPRARQAVSMAINREEIVDLVMEGLAEEAYNLFPESDPFHNDASNPPFDLEAAKALVAEYEADTGRPLEFTYDCRPDIRATSVIERQLSAAGMKVSVQNVSGADRLAAYLAGDYQAVCWTMAGFLMPDALPYRFFHSSGDLNSMGFDNAEFDSYVDQARQVADPARRNELWSAADEILAAEMPWVWTTSTPIGWIYSPDIESVDFDEPERLRYKIPIFENISLNR